MAKACEWSKRVAAWRASGLSAADVCDRHGYSVKGLWHWSSKLGRASGNVDRPRGVVRLARIVRPPVSEVVAEDGNIFIELGRARLTVRGRVDAVALRTVVEALRDGQTVGSR